MGNELIKITTNEEGKKLVSARELYKGLGLARTKWTNWNTKNIRENEFFEENKDWAEVSLEVTGGKTVDFAISLEFAKHLAMMSKTEKSHEYRNYFIDCERKSIELSQPKLPTTYKEALVALLERVEENERLQLENKQLEDEVTHKENVIIGLVQDISVAEKRQRISMIVKHNCKGKFQDRYRLLYSEFDKKFHIDTSKRLKNAIEKGIVKKSVNRMAYICEHMNMTNELYDICCKIFSNDVQQLMNEMWDCIV